MKKVIIGILIIGISLLIIGCTPSIVCETENTSDDYGTQTTTVCTNEKAKTITMETIIETTNPFSDLMSILCQVEGLENEGVTLESVSVIVNGKEICEN